MWFSDQNGCNWNINTVWNWTHSGGGVVDIEFINGFKLSLFGSHAKMFFQKFQGPLQP